MFDEYMTMYNLLDSMEHYKWLFLIAIIILVITEQYFKSRNKHYNTEYMRHLHMQETRLRSAKRELEHAKLELKAERMRFDSDYRVYCEKMRYLNSQK